MNKNAELLNFVYQNSQMGVHTLEQLIDIAENDNFKQHLNPNIENTKISIVQRKRLLIKTDMMKRELVP